MSRRTSAACIANCVLKHFKQSTLIIVIKALKFLSHKLLLAILLIFAPLDHTFTQSQIAKLVRRSQETSGLRHLTVHL